jgi:15-cis-phytoene synthase
LSAPGPVEQAYDFCEAVTRAQAANFFYGIRLLSRERRRAMFPVYAFARRVDDIGDGSLPSEEKVRLLEAEAAALARLEGGAEGVPGGDPVMLALADVHARFHLPPGALGELIDGVRMDVDGVSYERLEDLVLYCRRVAGAVGRVCLAIFARSERAADAGHDIEALADELGVAMQLTNILRDLREDAENGRVYLPAEDLRRFGLIEEGQPGGGVDGAAALLGVLDRAAADAIAGRPDDGDAGGGGANGGGANGEEAQRLYALVRFEAERAREWFDRGLALAPLLDRRSAACVMAMAGIYRRLLDRIEARPEQALRTRMSLPAREKALVAARSMLGGHP